MSQIRSCPPGGEHRRSDHCRVDVIIARAFDSGAIGTSIKRQRTLEPFVTFDRGSTSGKPTAHVGGDAMTRRQHRVGFRRNPEEAGVKGKCIELQGMLTTSIASTEQGLE